MAALSLGHCFSTKSSSSQEIHPRNDLRVLISMSCHGRQTFEPMNSKAKKDEKKGDKGRMQLLLTSVEKFGKGLKENLSPKQKGDWKDLTLMCLSFALYVYISQKIVCAYCSWMSMAKHPW